MDKIRAISIKDTREAKGMQMLKVNEITKSVDPSFEQATCLHINGNLFLHGIESDHSVVASEGGEGRS